MNKEPEINFTNERRFFSRNESNELDRLYERYYEDPKDQDKIYKTQCISDLTRIRHVMNLTEQKNGCIGYGVGNTCYLFLEDNEVKIKTMKSHRYSGIFDTKYGPMITNNHGEWGGVLFNSTDDGLEIAGKGNYIHVFEYNDKVYEMTTLTHLISSSCSLREIKKHDDKFEEITIFDSDDLNFAGYYVDKNYIYFCSDYKGIFSKSDDFRGLYRFNLDNNELECIKKNLFGEIKINSLIKKDNIVYIYGTYNLIEYDLSNGNIRTYTNLEPEMLTEFFYVGDIKLIDLWGDLVI